MLENCSCTATQKLIEDACSADVALRPAADTPLVELVKSCTTMAFVDLTKRITEVAKEDNAPVTQVTGQALAEQSNNSLHNGWLDEISARAAAVVSRRVEIIRETVIPAVRSVTEEVMRDIQALETITTIPSITRYHACDLVSVDAFMADVKRSARTDYLSPDKPLRQKNMDNAGIHDLLDQGSDTLNTALAVATSRIGDDNLFRLWESIFVDTSLCQIKNYGSFDSFVMHPDFGFEYAILIFKLASAIKDDHAETLRQYREASAFWILAHNKRYQAELASKTLIRTRRNYQGKVEVNGLVYTEFLQAGGNVEMVLGAAASKELMVMSDEILKNSAKVMATYGALNTAASVANANQMKATFNSSLGRSFERSFRHERSELEASFLAKNPGAIEAIAKMFTNRANIASVATIQDAYRHITEIMCVSRFYYVDDCLGFLKAVDDGCKEGLDAESALARATLDEIINYVVGQIRS